MKTAKPTYSISEVIHDVASALRSGDDHSATTIRCAINDHLDAMHKDGYRVNFEYDQQRAVREVKRLLAFQVNDDVE
jgi:hypothetical protein